MKPISPSPFTPNGVKFIGSCSFYGSRPRDVDVAIPTHPISPELFDHGEMFIVHMHGIHHVYIATGSNVLVIVGYDGKDHAIYHRETENVVGHAKDDIVASHVHPHMQLIIANAEIQAVRANNVLVAMKEMLWF